MKNALTLCALCCGLLVGCGNAGDRQAAVAGEAEGRVACSEPRPQFCTRDYRPVCATRDNGVRCVTTPCDSTEQKTYSNGCSACSDPKVYAHVPGPCETSARDAVD